MISCIHLEQAPKTDTLVKMYKEFGKYIYDLRFKIVFDINDNRIYILNIECSSILFIIDIIDSCVYINQDIIDKYRESDIREYLDINQIDYVIFPYYSEVGDVKKLEQTRVEKLKKLSREANNVYIGNGSINLFNDAYHLLCSVKIDN